VFSGEVLSARLWTRDTICEVTLNVRLMLNRLRATAAARNIASRIYLCRLARQQTKRLLTPDMMNAVLN